MAFEKNINFARQTTLSQPVTFQGISLHKGEMVTINLLPLGADNGVEFCRVDLADELGREGATIPARFDNVTETMLGTTISNAHGASVSTIEHLMAAIAGAGLDNVLVEIDGPEVPVMDGSSIAFLEEIEKVGIVELGMPRKAIRVLKQVTVVDGEKRVELSPEAGFSVNVAIDFTSPVIGQQKTALNMVNGTFRKELGRARTFGFLKDVEAMKSVGLGLGGSLDNAIVIDEDKVLNEDGLRFDDEFVRHKALDAVGDLALAGAPLLAAFKGNRPGHDMNNRILRALFADPSAFEVVVLTEADAARLPSLA